MAVNFPKTLKKNFDKISFSKPKPNKYGGNNVYVRFGDSNLSIVTPSMAVPYGLSVEDLTDKAGQVLGKKYSLSVSFRGMDHDDDPNQAKLKEFHEVCEMIDDLMVETGTKNALTWLKQPKASKEVIQTLYTPMLKKSKDKETQLPDGKWPDTVRGKVLYDDNSKEFATKVFLSEDKETAVSVVDNLRKGAKVRCIFECGGVYFSNGKFGLTWKIHQIAVDSLPARLNVSQFAIPDEDDSDDEGDVKPKEVAKPSVFDTEVDDSDEEDELDKKESPKKEESEEESDEESEEERPPTPPPVKKKATKKRVVKKKKDDSDDE
tara:strand:+ start:1766 stop:2725 length:960 start_codon:yes stop_codon:yes gene_type:complete